MQDYLIWGAAIVGVLLLIVPSPMKLISKLFSGVDVGGETQPETPDEPVKIDHPHSHELHHLSCFLELRECLSEDAAIVEVLDKQVLPSLIAHCQKKAD